MAFNPELIADLFYIAEYADTLREKLIKVEPITNADIGFANRMKDLTDKACGKITALHQEKA